MTHPLPDHERGSSPAGAAALRLATLAFASPLPQGSWAQRRQSNLQKDFYTGRAITPERADEPKNARDSGGDQSRPKGLLPNGFPPVAQHDWLLQALLLSPWPRR